MTLSNFHNSSFKQKHVSLSFIFLAGCSTHRLLWQWRSFSHPTRNFYFSRCSPSSWRKIPPLISGRQKVPFLVFQRCQQIYAFLEWRKHFFFSAFKLSISYKKYWGWLNFCMNVAGTYKKESKYKHRIFQANSLRAIRGTVHLKWQVI